MKIEHFSVSYACFARNLTRVFFHIILNDGATAKEDFIFYLGNSLEERTPLYDETELYFMGFELIFA